MAGFLDSKERVIDMVLTGVGKDLLTKGDLRFVYWVPFDDEVDYDPYIAESSSLTAEELLLAKQLKTEDPLVREASSGYRFHNLVVEDQTNLNRPMFTIPPGQKVIPQMVVDSGSLDVKIQQQKIFQTLVQKDSDGNVIDQMGPFDMGVLRYNPSENIVHMKYSSDSYPADFPLEGFMVTVYHSSSDGYVEVLHNRDSGGDVVFSNDMKVEDGSK